jgi:hypothetical protein
LFTRERFWENDHIAGAIALPFMSEGFYLPYDEVLPSHKIPLEIEMMKGMPRKNRGA